MEWAHQQKLFGRKGEGGRVCGDRLGCVGVGGTGCGEKGGRHLKVVGVGGDGWDGQVRSSR